MLSPSLMMLGLALPGSLFAQAVPTSSFAMGGQIAAGTCSVASVAQTMPEVSASVFVQNPGAAGGVVSSYTPFVLGLAGCSGVLGASFTLGEAADAEPTHATAFRNKAPDAAPFTSIWLKTDGCDSSGTITPGRAFSRTFSTPDYELDLCAQYHKHRGGLVTQGGISTTFTVTVTYL